MDDEVLGSHLKPGQSVAYDGHASSDGILDPHPPLDVLRKGHPGRIRDGTPQHVMVDWVGLEEEPVSFAAGFVNERRFENDDIGRVLGLRLISDEEFERRAAVIRAGGTPASDA